MPTGGVTPAGGGGGSSPLLTKKVTLQSANLLALGTTPFTLVAAVTGQIICPFALISSVHYGTVTYNEAGQGRVFIGSTFATSGWGSTFSPFAALNALKTTATYATVSHTFVNMLDDSGEDLTALVAQPFRIDETAPVTLGDGTIDITTLYYLLTP